MYYLVFPIMYKTTFILVYDYILGPPTSNSHAPIHPCSHSAVTQPCDSNPKIMLLELLLLVYFCTPLSPHEAARGITMWVVAFV